MDNDQIREMLSERGVTVASVTSDQLKDLHQRLSEKLAASDCFRGTYKMNPMDDEKFMTCQASYFSCREAVSFNPDGFIGMAGWASSSNVAPIREAVIEWADSIGRTS